MDDLISRQAAIDALEKYYKNFPKSDRKVSLPVCSQVCEVLYKVPSVEPEIIRCRDCKHYKTMFCKMDIWHKDITIYTAKENDFCSYAEKKDA